MPNSQTADPLAIFQALAQAGIPFVIIGGHAVNFHGYVRTTEDADVVFQRTPTSEAQLLRVLQTLNACWVSDELDPQTGVERLVPVTDSYLATQHLMMLATDKGFLDLYDYIPGYPETPVEQLFTDAVQLDELKFVSLVWLRKMKTQAARRRDLDDLENLPTG